MKTYGKVYFCCLFFAISGRSRTQRKTCEKFPIYGNRIGRSILYFVTVGQQNAVEKSLWKGYIKTTKYFVMADETK